MQKIALIFFFLIGLMLPSSCGNIRPFQNWGLQVPSPDWSKQVIYFVMTDRFNDGNPSNNNMGAGEYNPALNSHYSGGDLRGIIDKLDYIQGLGVTALWITPPILNQWINRKANYTGYHGYWASDFSRMDPHVGTLDDYQELSRALHSRGMYLIQDIVCNHTGDFFTYTNFDPNHPEKGVVLNESSTPPFHPAQSPLDQNDPRDPKERKLGIYHCTPDVSDYKDKQQLLNYQMSGLDDLNTANPLVRNILKDSYNFWIQNVGVDGFRIDTALYVEHDFWCDFLHFSHSDHPGVKTFAARLGKEHFYTFGEAWVNVLPYQNKGDLIAASFQGTPKDPEMDAPIAFPLQVTLQRVFGEGKPTAWMSYRIKRLLTDYSHPEILPTFVDNHDMNRFLKSSDVTSLKQALITLFTLPGVPVIYYGTEQGFTETRSSMFAGGYGSDSRDHFDTHSELYGFLSNLIRLRRANALFRSTNMQLLADNPVKSGVLAYLKTEGEQHALVLINTSAHSTLLDPIQLPWQGGTVLRSLLAEGASRKTKVLDAKGRLALVLPPKSADILVPLGKHVEIKGKSKQLSLDVPVKDQSYSKNVLLKGQLQGGKVLRMVIDGDMSQAVKIHVDSNGHWEVELPVESLPNGRHFVSFYTRDSKPTFLVSEGPFFFDVKIPYMFSAYWRDPIGDDVGPKGTYVYPLDPSFSHQADLSAVRLSYAGKNLKLELTLSEPLSVVWNPRLGFDHVTFAIFVDFPNLQGQRILPQLQAQTPDGMNWDVMALIGGWMNFLFSAKGSSADDFGTPLTPAPIVQVETATQTVSVILSLDQLPLGTKVYVCTWDYDGLEGKFRPLAPEPAPFGFGGGKPEDPKVMDDIPVLEIK